MSERWLEQNPWPIVLCMTLPFALIGVYLIYQAWTMQVYYNPDDPAQTALNPSVPFNWVLMLVGVGLIAVMLIVWLTIVIPGIASQLNK